MDIKIIFISFSIFLGSCGECKPDKYGEILELVVPIRTLPAKDTFEIGDTILIEANFSKEIQIYNTNNSIKLDSFIFFTQFVISEISDTVEKYKGIIDTIVEVGHVGYLPLQDDVVAYPVSYHEDDEGYHLVFRIILKTSGRFWVAFSSSSLFYDKPYYDHPALYVCNNNRRDRVEVFFENSSTTHEAYSSIFLKTKVDYLHQLVDFDRYEKAGSICIIVQ